MSKGKDPGPCAGPLQGRYSRQILFAGIGEKGQRRLAESHVAIVGCGALGSGAVQNLARAGVGRLTVVDRDFLEVSNLHRQCLYEEEDVLRRLPKAVAAAGRVRRINSEVEIAPVVEDVHRGNVCDILRGAHIVLDGTDNMETRFLVNDACLKLGIPWVYGGAVASTGMTMTILPGKTPCLRCVFGGPPPPGSLPTADTMGVLNTLTAAISALEASEVIKFLVGGHALNDALIQFDVWEPDFRKIPVQRRPDCRACAGEYDFLQGTGFY